MTRLLPLACKTFPFVLIPELTQLLALRVTILFDPLAGIDGVGHGGRDSHPANGAGISDGHPAGGGVGVGVGEGGGGGRGVGAGGGGGGGVTI